MFETIQAATLLGTAIGAVCTGIAAILRVHYWGKAHLRRAERGDPEMPCQVSLLQLLLQRRQS